MISLLLLSFALPTTAAGAECINPVFKLQYMSSLTCFKNAEREILGTNQQDSFDQSMATALSYLGEEHDARKVFDRGPRYSPPSEPFDPKDWAARPAEDEILARLGDRQLVLINEAHHVAQTRGLTLQLLKPLYDRGFRYLALETFSEPLEPTIQLGYATTSTGFYSAEPVLARIIREALKLGYKLVPYESSPDCDPFHEPPEKCQNLREEGQAKNLMDRVFKIDPNAKLLVHAGYGHISKREPSGHSKWIPMARYLWSFSGIEPLSIDQATYFKRGRATLNADVYQKAVEHFRFRRAVILVNRKSRQPFVSEVHRTSYDLQVFLPPVSKSQSWKSSLSNTTGVHTRRWHCPRTHLCLVQAFHRGDSRWAIPADQALVNGGIATLYLPPGRYDVHAVNSRDQVMERRHVRVGK